MDRPLDWLPFDRVKWPLFALLASAAMLAAAHAFEYFLYLAPCPLCYVQREIYWGSGAIAIIGIFANWRGAPPRLMSMICLLLGVAFLAGAGVATYHSLVEWKILPAPATCAAGGSHLSGDIWAQLGKRQAIASCDKPMWYLFGLTMANYNVLLSVVFGAASLFAALRPLRTDTANETGAEPETA